MKKALSTNLTLFLIGILFLIIPFTAIGQKLPDVQEKSNAGNTRNITEGEFEIDY